MAGYPLLYFWEMGWAVASEAHQAAGPEDSRNLLLLSELCWSLKSPGSL